MRVKKKTKKEEMKFVSVSPILSQDKAEIVGAELYRLSETLTVVKPEDVVEAAKAETSPLHCFFDWNDTTAAHKYRLKQARGLLRSVEIRIIKEGKEDKQLPLMQSLRITTVESTETPVLKKQKTVERQERVYMSITEVLADPELEQQVIQNAARELNSFRLRYERYVTQFPEFRTRYRELLEAALSAV